jgi:hypothetical protein
VEGGLKQDAPQFEDDDHELVVQQFEEFANGTINSRALQDKCRQYRDGDQYTAEERKIYQKRKQPCITDNKIEDKCDTLLGIEKNQRTDPKCYPRNPSEEDEQGAEAATDGLRFVADQCTYKTSVRKPAADNLIVEGICAGQVIVEKKRGQAPKVLMEHIRRDRAYYDIYSLKDDFSDKTYCGYFTWMDAKVAEEDWPDKKDALNQSGGSTSQSGPDPSLDDKPRYVITSGKRKRVQVFYHYLLKKGKWHEAVWCRGGWLEEPKPCVYKDEFGQPACCMEIQALKRKGDDGSPYGAVPRYLDLQDEHNKRRSKMLHLLNAKRIKMRKGAVDDVNKLRAEVHKPDGVLEINGVPEDVVIEDNLAEAEGQWRLLQQTDVALSQTGPNSALGGTSGDLSGVAKARDQQAGQLPISPLFDALDAWELRMYRQAWNRIRQYWTAPMWIRVTDDEEKIRFVGFNQPVLMGDRLAQAAAQDPQFQQLQPEQQRGIIHEIASRPEAQQQALDDKTGKPMAKNKVGELDVDIIVDRGQDVITVQQEEFAQLAEIAKGRPEIPFDVIVEMSQLRPTTKKRVLERMKGGNDPLAAQQAQFQQMMQQLQLLITKATARKTEAEAAKAEAGAAKDQAAAEETHVDTAVKVATFTSPQPADPNAAPGAQPGGKSSVSVN